ncbi:uncharacterized protein LOC117653938 [Thrips palmi]|uniref:Uncharacterized protein LOC117653938 n=1 Tax=Thrips palmi TaxID=161013 RepID=A0A6P9ACI2_THRPL|nr:uncharacterized protein LOC117653938 [Thrips palmi]
MNCKDIPVNKFERQYNKLVAELHSYQKKVSESKKLVAEIRNEIHNTEGSVEEQEERKVQLEERAMASWKSLKEVRYNMQRISREMDMLKNKMLMKIESQRRNHEGYF